jgi:GT2 family glycosyltransferase
MLISIILCTHDRAAFLERCLLALVPAPGTPDDWEIVVVANACSDDTVARVAALAGRFGGALRTIEEPTPGLSLARNVGAAAAKGKYLVYLDDDAVPGIGWLDAHRKYFLRHPSVLAGGGPIDPDWGSLDRPAYWRPEFEVNRASLRFPDAPDYFPEGHLPFGANMFLQADAFKSMGGFDRSLGMNGKRLGLAEETEWFLRLKRTGARIGYVADAPVSHWVNPRDITRSGLLRRAFEAGIVAVNVFHVQRPARGWLGWCRHTLSATLRFRLHMGEQVFLAMELGQLWATSRWGRPRETP